MSSATSGRRGTSMFRSKYSASDSVHAFLDSAAAKRTTAFAMILRATKFQAETNRAKMGLKIRMALLPSPGGKC